MISSSEIAAVLLAAGQSSRFGRADKLLAPLWERPLAMHASQTLAELDFGWRIAVCPSFDAPVAGLLATEGFDIVPNPDARDGLSTSLACGVRHAAATGATAALVCLGDMPLVDSSHLLKLMKIFDPVRNPVVASSRESVAMPPALFARSMFERLMELQGDHGAKRLLADAVCIPAPSGMLADIDHPDDLLRVQRSG